MANERVQIGDHTFELENAMRGGLRWAVGTPDGPRSSIWRLWGNKKGDVYLSVRSLGGILKASFHRDRRCQVGFTSNYTETAIQRFGARSRHWERWVLPEAPTVRAVQIVVPANELVPFGANDASQMKWLPPPAAGAASVVSVFIAEPPSAADWPGPESGGQMLGFVVRKTRATWAAYSSHVLDATTKQHIEEARVKAAQLPDAAEAPRTPGIRAVL
jgi:hypothetical protein